MYVSWRYNDGFSFGYVDLQDQQESKAEMLKRHSDIWDMSFENKLE